MEATDTMEQAVNSLLDIEPEQTEEIETEEVETDEVETDEVEVEETEADEDEDEGEEPESDEDDEDEDTDADEKPELHKVKVDGEEREVTLDELKRGYSGQQKVQKGMQQAAEVRKQAEGLYQTLQSERQQFLATVQQMQQQGIVTPPKAPEMSMLETDPIGYMQEKAAYDVKMQEFQNQQRQIQAEQVRAQQLQESARQVQLQEQVKALVQRIPEFANPETAANLKRELLDYGMSKGLSAEELQATTNAAYVDILYDAYRFRQLQSGTAKAKKKPESPRNVKPKPRRSEPQKIVQKRKLQAARKSGKPESFVDFLLE